MNAKIDVITESYRKTSNGCMPVVLRLTKDRKRKIIRLGININPDHWDATKNQIRPSCPDYEYLESIITDRKSKFQKQVLEFQSVGKDYSLTQLANAVDKPTKNTTVSEYLNKVIQDLKTEGRIGNAAHYESLLNSLHKFTKVLQLLFVDIDTSFLNRYESHLRGQGNRGNTISNKMRTLRAVYNKAIKENVVKVDYYPFTDYNVSKLKESTSKRSISV